MDQESSSAALEKLYMEQELLFPMLVGFTWFTHPHFQTGEVLPGSEVLLSKRVKVFARLGALIGKLVRLCKVLHP